jgi:hypothetical protein
VIFGAARETRSRREADAPLPQIARYLTDGTSLYRFVGWIARGRLAELEDCRSLDLLVMPALEIEAAGLRPVGV